METQVIEIGEWLPDQAELGHPGVTEAKNCLPQAKTYRSLHALAPFADPLPSPALGGVFTFDAAGNTSIFVGTHNNLYRLSGDEWLAVGRTGGYTGVARWEFAYFRDYVLAVNGIDKPQYYLLPTDNVKRFADIASARESAHVSVVNGFVVIAPIVSSTAAIQWSAYNNPLSWSTPAMPLPQAQADEQSFDYAGGAVQSIISGTSGTIIREHSILRMRYSRPPVVFALDEVARNKGTPAPDSVVSYGKYAYFYSHDGFCQYDTESGDLAMIGDERVDRWFADACTSDNRRFIRGSIDPINGLVFWAFRRGVSEVNTDILIFNIKVQKWSYAEVPLQIALPAVGVGVSLDEMTSGSLYASLEQDNLPSLDSDFFRRKSFFHMAVDNDNCASLFSGAPLPAVIESGLYGGPNDTRRYTSCVRPLVEKEDSTGTVSVKVCGKPALEEEATCTGYVPLNRIGKADFRRDDRYQKYSVLIEGGFEHFNGFSVQVNYNTGHF